MSRARNVSCNSNNSDQGIPALYQNLPAELLAAIPDDIRSPKLSECGGSPSSLGSGVVSSASFFRICL